MDKKIFKIPTRQNQQNKPPKTFSSPPIWFFLHRLGSFTVFQGGRVLAETLRKMGVGARSRRNQLRKPGKIFGAVAAAWGNFPPIYLASQGWPRMESRVGGSSQQTEKS